MDAIKDGVDHVSTCHDRIGAKHFFDQLDRLARAFAQGCDRSGH